MEDTEVYTMTHPESGQTISVAKGQEGRYLANNWVFKEAD